MDDEMRAAFGRIDRYFELGYAETRSLRGEVRAMGAELKALGAELKAHGAELKAHGAELKALRADVNANSDELRSFRDWVVTQFAELRAELRGLSK